MRSVAAGPARSVAIDKSLVAARGKKAVCKNNLHQLNLAIANFAESQKRLPASNPSGLVGGWAIEVLPFLEQNNLAQGIQTGIAIADAPDFLLERPPIFRCPIREALDDHLSSAMHRAHYVFGPMGRRDSYSLYDAPLRLSEPWASNPEIDAATLGRVDKFWVIE